MHDPAWILRHVAWKTAESGLTATHIVLVRRLLGGRHVAEKMMVAVSNSDSVSRAGGVAQAAAETRYRFWVRDSAVSSWRQLQGVHTMAEIARMLRQQRFVEIALIDGSAHPA